MAQNDLMDKTAYLLVKNTNRIIDLLAIASGRLCTGKMMEH